METKPIIPSEEQLHNCELMGWEYIGDGLFAKGEAIGYFTIAGWVKA
tara:strand:+ start:1795 stop:1935 length:141 start_codon:yes stop_codon:yes gene_type:complete